MELIKKVTKKDQDKWNKEVDNIIKLFHRMKKWLDDIDKNRDDYSWPDQAGSVPIAVEIKKAYPLGIQKTGL